MAPPVEPLNGDQKAIIDFINKNDLSGLKVHMSQLGIKPTLVDEHGMTPLSHAAYKGYFEICQYLLDQGADPNDSHHQHGYSALHFAGLSGNVEVCQLLLEAGANMSALNSVGRTAAETAAFVGNYRCVSSINNFLPKSEVDYYSVIHGLETEPKLSPALAAPLHKFIIQVNVHPVRISLNLQPKLIKHLKQIKNVLELMCSKEMRKGSGSNEIMAFKLHYLSAIIAEIQKYQVPEKQSDAVETFVRKILRSGRGEGYMDLLIREAVREFPYRNSALLVQMVTSLAKNNESPEALSVVTQAINGQHGFLSDVVICATCAEENPAKKCSKCRQVQYCDRECQRLHWFIHKKECNRNVDDLSNKLDTMKVD